MSLQELKEESTYIKNKIWHFWNFL
jgi:hypothetical protein